MRQIHSVLLICFFYIGWFGSVLLALTKYSFLSLIFPLALFTFLFCKSPLSLRANQMAIAIAILGILFDISLIKLGLVKIQRESPHLAPIWLFSIWLLFSFSMMKLGQKWKVPIWLATVLGLIGGPLSYKSGELFGIITFSQPVTFLIYALFWSIMFPSTLFFSRKFA